MNNVELIVLINYIIENKEFFSEQDKEKICRSLKKDFVEKESAFEIFNDIVYLKNTKQEMILFTHNTFILSIKPEDIKKDNIVIQFIDPIRYEIGKIIKIGEESFNSGLSIREFFIFILKSKSKYFNYKKEAIEIIEDCKKNKDKPNNDIIELKIEDILEIIGRCYKKN